MNEIKELVQQLAGIYKTFGGTENAEAIINVLDCLKPEKVSQLLTEVGPETLVQIEEASDNTANVSQPLHEIIEQAFNSRIKS